jgi:hypothetical protein
MHLKVYTEKQWLGEDEKHTIMLYPYWGDAPVEDGDPDKGRFDDWIQKGPAVFSITPDKKEAHVFLLPYEFSFSPKSLERTLAISRDALAHGKKLLVFYNNDNDQVIPVSNTIVFRTSFYESNKGRDTHALPGWSVDFMSTYGKEFFPLREPDGDLRISYCGYVDYQKYSDLLRKKGMRFFFRTLFSGDSGFDRGTILRGKAVRLLLREKTIKTIFLIRSGFWASELKDKYQARKDYANNMLSAEYTLIIRGAGNFSYRLYEAMSCGRIPVFINTDCALPFSEFIDWKKHTVWIEESQIGSISGVLRQFHEGKTRQDILSMQKESRKIYEQWLSPSGFFGNIYRYIL